MSFQGQNANHQAGQAGQGAQSMDQFKNRHGMTSFVMVSYC